MAAKRKILATNALPYANGVPHLGHLVGTIQGDIWVRYQKMLGSDCLYICGSDAHGTPIMIKAEQMGVSPEELIADIREHQYKDFTDFLVDFDNFHTTHSPENEALVKEIFLKHQDAGNISKREITQLYDPIKNMFLPDRYVKGECPKCHAKDQYGDNCESCGAIYAPTDLIDSFSVLSGAKPILKDSVHYFFKLQNFADYLQKWTQQGHLQPQVINKLDEWFEAGLREWDISRDAPYFGFKIPGDENKYLYVWLDAPIGYMASFKNLCAKRPELNFDDYWLNDDKTELYHFIGKDIIYFHALFWPAILAGAGYRTPNEIMVNGFLTIDGQKMSKSRGTFIRARTYLNHLPPEYLRYYFAAKLSSRIEDIDINFTDLMNRINSDLVGKFVNIASRCANFLTKYFNGTLSPTLSEPELFQHFASTGDEIGKQWDTFEYSQAIRNIMLLADRANQYIDEKKPWAAIKDSARSDEVRDICSMGINLFRQLMIYLKPILPETAKSVEAFLNCPPFTWADKDTALLSVKINEFKPLMQRIDPKQIEAMKMSEQTETKAVEKTEEKNYISIDDFAKVDLRIAKILKAEVVEDSDKLLRLEVDLGDEKRQILAGIKEAYSPESLVGKQVVIVANLAPRKMRFGVSEGMVIVASGPQSEGLFIISPESGAMPGMKVK